MAGKPLTQTSSRAVAFAIDQLTKNQMADVLIDLARRQIGEDAGDDAILDEIQGFVDPIIRARGDGVVKLRIKYDHYTQASDLYAKRHVGE